MVRTAWLLLLAVLLTAAAVQAQPDEVSTVRVALLTSDAPRTATLHAEAGELAVYLEGVDTPVATIQAGEDVEVRVARSGQVQMGDVIALALRVVPRGEARFALEAGGTRRVYPGTLDVGQRQGALRLVNEVGIETYVASVLGSEYGLDEAEGARAMAVAIRTYAARATGKHGEDADHADGISSQVYRGYEGITPGNSAAAEATRGEVLLYDGALIEAVYHASSGGHTANNEDLWEGTPLPYLRARPDPYDARHSPHDGWTSRVDRSRLLDALSRRHGHGVRGFLLDGETRAGRVRNVELLRGGGARETISAEAFRRVVNATFGAHGLRSTWFDARRRGSEYVFEGRGYGHGVGLSQWGAHGQSEDGRSYREILGFYYPGTSLAQLGEATTVELPSEAPPSETPPALAEPYEPPTAEPIPRPATPPVQRTSSRGRIGW